MSEDITVRNSLRKTIDRQGVITCKKLPKAEDEKGIYKDYYDFSILNKRLKSHQILALNRAVKQKVLKVSIEFEDDMLKDIIDDILNIKHFNRNKAYSDILKEASEDSFKRLLMPSLFNEKFSELVEEANIRAVEVFSTNLRNLMLQKPVSGKRILGIDPGFRTGSKLVAINEMGDILAHDVIFPHPPQNKVQESEAKVLKHIKDLKLNLIVIGNGTASRETQSFIADMIKKHSLDIKYAIVSESGASVYSASKTSVEEFPEYDVTTRGAISIARRVQDPLAEFVKIPPESIGVGMYQHDINATILKKSLEREVESVVNFVGINLNTASKHILKYISGLNSKSAQNIVDYRKANGAFKNRKELLKVSGVGPKAYEQAAGFCRIPDSNEKLDNTTIHPENYVLTKKLIEHMDIDFDNFKKKSKSIKINYSKLAQDLESQEITIKDIIDALNADKLDPRDSMPDINLSDDVLSIDDLQVGMSIKGTITNVVDFGAFVDIGIKNSALLHKSQYIR